MLLRQESGWQAWAYLWNAAQSDAALKIAGAKVDIAIGRRRTVRRWPSPIRSRTRTSARAATPSTVRSRRSGPKARNLNGELAYAGGTKNQLAQWTAAEYAERSAGASAAPTRAPDWRDAFGAARSVAPAPGSTSTARIAIAREGPASNSGLFLTFGETDPVAYGVVETPRGCRAAARAAANSTSSPAIPTARSCCIAWKAPKPAS